MQLQAEDGGQRADERGGGGWQDGKARFAPVDQSESRRRGDSRQVAFDYLAKPANADEVVTALMAGRLDMPAEHEPPMSADRVRWEHIQHIYEACGRNVSQTARKLNMHRRTLQRILTKRAPK